jgi:hypothetical protein
LIALARINNVIISIVGKTYLTATIKKPSVAIASERYYESESAVEEVEEGKKIPALLMIVISVAYILLGGYLFYSNEGWSFVNAVYFSFVTISSIGFGRY